ncbi:bone marrow proteoglycan-like [Emydura macquarii macquarii]|uniref:bone marrow proteoglycan-like n=1 Tax=Emydura macquarii macquarii TaxID=1129001 RepID=UPI00352B4214
MKLSLALALALLGAVSARHLPEGTLEQEVPGELGSSVLEEELREHKKPHFRMVNQPQTFHEAEKECVRLFGGHLASVHNHPANAFLRSAAKSRTNNAQVWIGGIISSSGGRPFCRWVDKTHWNYTNWASGNPSRSGETCVALCTAGGHWRSASCGTRLPFICES